MRLFIGMFLALFLAVPSVHAKMTVRVDCESVFSSDPYVSVRGSLVVQEGQGWENASGNLRIRLQGSQQGQTSVRGHYEAGYRKREFLLRALSGRGVREIFISIGSSVGKDSYVQLENGSEYKMSCRVGI